MTTDRQKRIETLGKRFSETAQQEQTKSSDSGRNRKQHSIYIDSDLMKRVDKAFKQFQHEIYPAEITKSLFMECLLEKGLENIEEIKTGIGESE